MGHSPETISTGTAAIDVQQTVVIAKERYATICLNRATQAAEAPMDERIMMMLEDEPIAARSR